MCHGRKSRLFGLRENQRRNMFLVDLWGVPPPHGGENRGGDDASHCCSSSRSATRVLRNGNASSYPRDRRKKIFLRTNKSLLFIYVLWTMHSEEKEMRVPNARGIVSWEISRVSRIRDLRTCIYSCANLPASFLSATHALISMRIRKHKV